VLCVVAVLAGYPANEKSVIPHLDNFAAKLNDPGWGDDNMKAIMLQLVMKIADHSPTVSDRVYECNTINSVLKELIHSLRRWPVYFADI
jgi:hypothetical protein